MSGKWIGECKQCGKCCTVGIYWLFFNNDVEKEEMLAWAGARGCSIRQIGRRMIQAEFEHICPKLMINHCSLHESGKPNWCKNAPLNYNTDDFLLTELDPNKAHPEGCGFKYVLDTND